MTTMFVNILDQDVVMFGLSILFVTCFLTFLLVRSLYRLDMYARGWYDAQYTRIEHWCKRTRDADVWVVYVDSDKFEDAMLKKYNE